MASAIRNTLQKLTRPKKKGGSTAVEGSLGEMARRSSSASSVVRSVFSNIIEKKANLPPVIPMPDEEEIKRVQRRRNARRTGGRSSTVLTSGDYAGMGG